MTKLAPYWKAVVGFVAPAMTGLIFALQDTSPGGTSIVKEEWLLGLFTCIATSYGVWQIPNKAASNNKERA